MVEPKFLCVFPNYHKRRLAPVLMKELRRRLINDGHKCGVFATKELFAKPYTTVTFYSRALNARKILGTGFIKLPPGVPIEAFEQNFKCTPLAEI